MTVFGLDAADGTVQAIRVPTSQAEGENTSRPSVVYPRTARLAGHCSAIRCVTRTFSHSICRARGETSGNSPARRTAQPRSAARPGQAGQAGLHPGGHARRDRAGRQSQRAFPSCRCSATACPVTVARSRSLSCLASAREPARQSCPAGHRRRQRARLRVAADMHHRQAVHLPLLGGFPLGGLAGEHRHEDLVLLAGRQPPARPARVHDPIRHYDQPPVRSGAPARGRVFARSNGSRTQAQTHQRLDRPRLVPGHPHPAWLFPGG